MNRLAPISLESKTNKLGIRLLTAVDIFNYRGFKMAYYVKPETSIPATDIGISDTPMESNNSIIQSGDGNDISALCNYVPVTLPPESTGDVPIGIALKIKKEEVKEVEEEQARIIGGSYVTPHEYPFMVTKRL